MLAFDSEAEASRWDDLLLMYYGHDPEIKGLLRQVVYELHTTHYETGERTVVCRYVADFVYLVCVKGRQAVPVVEDVKGHLTREYKLKRKWMQLEYGVIIKEVNYAKDA